MSYNRRDDDDYNRSGGYGEEGGRSHGGRAEGEGYGRPAGYPPSGGGYEGAGAGGYGAPSYGEEGRRHEGKHQHHEEESEGGYGGSSYGGGAYGGESGGAYGGEGRRPEGKHGYHHGSAEYGEEGVTKPVGPPYTGEEGGVQKYTTSTTAPGYSQATMYESGPGGYQAATTYTAVVSGPMFTIRSKDDTSLAVAADIRNPRNGLVLKPVDENDRSQLWRLEMGEKEEGKWQVITMINVETNKAAHPTEEGQPVGLGDVARSKWSLGKDEGGHYFAVRPAGNKDINWDAWGGKARAGASVGLHEWLEQDNQMWGFFPKGSRKPVLPWDSQVKIETELDRQEKLGEAEHDYKEHVGEEHALGLGAVTAGAFAAYEQHRAKVDPEHAQRHKIESEVAAVAMAGLGIGATYEGYEAHQDKKDKKKYADEEEKKGWF